MLSGNISTNFSDKILHRNRRFYQMFSFSFDKVSFTNYVIKEIRIGDQFSTPTPPPPPPLPPYVVIPTAPNIEFFAAYNLNINSSEKNTQLTYLFLDFIDRSNCCSFETEMKNEQYFVACQQKFPVCGNTHPRATLLHCSIYSTAHQKLN